MSWWSKSLRRMPRSWITSVHFQPAFDVIVAVPSMKFSKTTSSPEIARPSNPVRSRPWRAYSTDSVTSRGITLVCSWREMIISSSRICWTRASWASVTGTTKAGTRVYCAASSKGRKSTTGSRY